MENCNCKKDGWSNVNKVNVDIVYLKSYAAEKKLEYIHDGDSGFDLRAGFNFQEGNWYINPGEVKVIQTGIRVAIPKGYEMQVRTRSGSPLKEGFFVINSPGTVDCITKNTILKTSIGNKTLEELMKNDAPRCISYNEKTKEFEEDEILKIWSVGEKDGLKFEMEDGSWFECTKNQLILTINGWKYACDLTIEDELI